MQIIKKILHLFRCALKSCLLKTPSYAFNSVLQTFTNRHICTNLNRHSVTYLNKLYENSTIDYICAHTPLGGGSRFFINIHGFYIEFI